MKKLLTYLKESKAEFNKVTWPTRKETINYSILVVIISLLIAVFIGLADYVLNLGVVQILNTTTETPVTSEGDLFSPDIQVQTDSGTPVDVNVETEASN